ncbi:MAG: hypothetical protein V7709_16690 [Halioglobus sp.]
MKQILNYTSTVVGSAGILLCATSGIARIRGEYYLSGYEATTLFSVGIGVMVFACLIKLEILLSGKE